MQRMHHTEHDYVKMMHATLKQATRYLTFNHTYVREWWEFAFSCCIDIKISKAGCSPLGAAIEYKYDTGTTTHYKAM